MRYDAGSCDVAVVGAGHAGIEAALAAARLGLDTVCFTINMDAIGNMPCNPAIGGTGKGHLVRELDALGGEMARAADRACIQYRMLNRGKGPAVHSLRAQADRRKYQAVMKHTLELQPNLRVKQAEVVAVETEDGRVSAVVTANGAVYRCRAAVLATGTYLHGRTIVGDVLRDSGPDGLAAAGPLAECCKALGLRMRRFKTGTPPRVNARTVDFSRMELQPGDAEIEPFSFSTTHPVENKAVCYLTYTNERTHAIIRANLDRSPIYSGVIEGVGPRYCPSIETKIMTFPDKPRHQLFIEPMGLDTEELYIQGFSSSLPEDAAALAGQHEGLSDSVFTGLDFLIALPAADALFLQKFLPLDLFLGQLRCGKLKLPDKAKVDLHLLYPVAVDFFRGVDDDFLNKLVDHGRGQLRKIGILPCQLQKLLHTGTVLCESGQPFFRE